MQTAPSIESIHRAMVDGEMVSMGFSDYLERVIVFYQGVGIQTVFRLDENYIDLLWVDAIFNGQTVNRGEFVDVCKALKQQGYRVHAIAENIYVRQWLRLGGFRKVGYYYEF